MKKLKPFEEIYPGFEDIKPLVKWGVTKEHYDRLPVHIKARVDVFIDKYVPKDDE